MEQFEITAIREAYAALNRNDVDGFVANFDPDVERIEPADVPADGVFHGIDAVRAHVAKGRGNWAEGGCEPERFIVAGDKIVVLVNVRVLLKGKTEWNEGRVGDVYTWRDGKIVRFRTFFDVPAALEYAGV